MSNPSFSSDELHENLQKMDPYQLEELVADLWAALGYETQVTSSAGDRGIDIVARKEDPFQRKQLIQVKRYNEENRIGSSEIRLYKTLYDQQENVDLVGIVTTSGFTDDALTLAQDLDVRTMDGDMLSRHLMQKVETDTISQYLSFEGNEDIDESSRHSSTNKLEKDTNKHYYDCFYCNSTFSTQSEARNHMQESHTETEVGQVNSLNLPNRSDGNVPCPVCGSSFHNETMMREHVSRAHPSLTLCSYCEKYFKNETKIRQHLDESHEYGDLSRIDQKRVEIYNK
jgi:uncharacterized C2H2 Zn-finger protein